MPDRDKLVALSRAVVDAVTFDDCGSMVAGQLMGGNGGLLSRETIKAVDALRHELSSWPGHRPQADNRSRNPL